MSEEIETTELPVGDFSYILGQKSDDTKWVDVPEWNCRVQIKALTKAEQIRLRKASIIRGVVDETKLEMNLFVYSVVQPKMSLDQVDTLFTESSAKALNRLTGAIIKLSGLDDNYLVEAEADFQE